MRQIYVFAVDMHADMAGSVYDTYVAALQHGKADVPGDAAKVGVVRRPTPWFSSEVDENCAALGPPEDLLNAIKSRQDELEERGLSDADAHNEAMEDVGYEERYLAYIDRSDAAREAIEELRERLARGEDIALVCYENTDSKRCHRTLLKNRVL